MPQRLVRVGRGRRHPSSGAGTTADIKTIAAHGCFGVGCITALTVQSTLGVRRSEPVSGKLIRDTTAYLLLQLVSGLHDLLLGLTQGDTNVITHTPPSMTYQQAFVIDKHNALLHAMDWGFAASLALVADSRVGRGSVRGGGNRDDFASPGGAGDSAGKSVARAVGSG